MIISMQGNWRVTVKSKSAAFDQRFVVQGALIGNGPHAGTPSTFTNVFGNQWSISIQNNPGTGWQASQTQIKFPTIVGGNYSFDIVSNDAGGDADFNDLILTCTTPVNVNTFMIFGNVTLYGGHCIFNPCRRFPYVIDTYKGLQRALKNPVLGDWIRKDYPERVPPIIIDDPNPPDPPYFSPIVFDPTEEALQPKTVLKYVRKATEDTKKLLKEGNEGEEQFAVSNFRLVSSPQTKLNRQTKLSVDNLAITTVVDRLFPNCITDPGANLTLSFEEYDRTAAEISGGPYTGTGNRRFLGNAITDMNGNYIFRFNFDMTVPGLEDSTDIAPGENVDTIIYPDVIVKIIESSPYRVAYESAPFYNIPNLKRINLCLPESAVSRPYSCFNGSLIGGLGKIFIGGNQNTAGSTLPPALRRYGFSNYLEANGVISVNSSLAGFQVECAAWHDVIDIKGCMYDEAKPFNQNNIVWYTLEIRRSGPVPWSFISENYKHPLYSKRNIAGYTGDDVGPFYPNVGGTLNGTVPAYKNIQREVKIGGEGKDWDQPNLDRYMLLHTGLYDGVDGVQTPGTFFLKVKGYDATGIPVPGATDLIALFIHNKPLHFELTQPVLDDAGIENAGCGLFRLKDDELHTPILFSFEARDPYGFVDSYSMYMSRCPGTPLAMTSNIEAPFTINSSPGDGHHFPGGSKPSNDHDAINIEETCPGFLGTPEAPPAGVGIAGLINVKLTPPAAGDGWIKPGEDFTLYGFSLDAKKRVTNGLNTGVYHLTPKFRQIMVERHKP